MTDDAAQKPPISDALHRLIVSRHLPDWYRQHARPVRRALAEQRLRLTHFIEDAGIYRSVHAVKRRLKTEASVREAIMGGRRKYLSDFKDFGGLRIVVHSRQDVKVIARFITRQAGVGDITIASDEEIKRENGYRARHIVIVMKGSYLRSGYEVDLEIQIRTLCEDLFDSLSRTYWYKNARVVPRPEDRDALVGHLKEAEALVTKLREEADVAHAADETDTLTPDSFQRIVKERLGDSVIIESAVDAVLMLRDDHVETNGDYLKYLADNKPKVDELIALERSLLGKRGPYGPKGLTYLMYRHVARGAFESFKDLLRAAAKAEPSPP